MSSKRVNVSLPAPLHEMCAEIAALTGDSLSGVVLRLVRGSAHQLLQQSLQIAEMRGAQAVRDATKRYRMQARRAAAVSR